MTQLGDSSLGPLGFLRQSEVLAEVAVTWKLDVQGGSFSQLIIDVGCSLEAPILLSVGAWYGYTSQRIC